MIPFHTALTHLNFKNLCVGFQPPDVYLISLVNIVRVITRIYSGGVTDLESYSSQRSL